MKKFYRTALALAGGLVILGILLTVLGLVLGAPLSSLSIKMPLNIRIFPHLSYSSSFQEENPDFFALYEGVRSLEIEGTEAAITIKNGDDFSIEAKHPASNFSSELHGSRWVIHSGELRSHQWPVHQAPEITITLPRDFVAEELNVELGVGSLTSAPLAAQKAELEVGIGEMTVETLDCPNLSLEVEMGSVNMTLAGREEDVAFSLENNMGSVSIGSRTWAGFDQEERWNPDAPRKAEISCSMGEVFIDWAK